MQWFLFYRHVHWGNLPVKQRKWKLLVWPVCQRCPHVPPGLQDVEGSIHSERINRRWVMYLYRTAFLHLQHASIWCAFCVLMLSNVTPCFLDWRWPVWRWAEPPCRVVPPVKPGVGAWCLGGTQHLVKPHSAADNLPPPSGSAWLLCAGECSHSVERNKDMQT